MIGVIKRSMRAKSHWTSLQEDWLSTPFCLEEGRLWDWRLFRLCRDKHIFGMLQHHMVMDGSSWRTLADYISTYYNGLVRGQPCEPPPTLTQALSLSEACHRAEEEALERTRGTSATFWRQTLEDAPWSVASPLLDASRRPTRLECTVVILCIRQTGSGCITSVCQGTTDNVVPCAWCGVRVDTVQTQ